MNVVCIVFHGAQSTVHVDFRSTRDERKESDAGDTIEGTMVSGIESWFCQ